MHVVAFCGISQFSLSVREEGGGEYVAATDISLKPMLALFDAHRFPADSGFLTPLPDETHEEFGAKRERL